MNDLLKFSPAVFAVDREYQIMAVSKDPCLMWVRVGEECYYDESNGILRSRNPIHRVSVPREELDRECGYTVCLRKIIERKPYFTETEEIVEKYYEFKPVRGGKATMYHIADAHNMVEEPVRAAKAFEKQNGEMDFLVLNGDIPEDSGRIEHFDTIYEIAARLTNGNKPTVFSRGNHDTRGIYAECIADYTPCHNGNSYFTFRLGDIWGIVLDCGEDKEDAHPEYGNTVCCHAFRKRETRFLENVIRNANTEYLAVGVKHRIVIVHNPFTEQLEKPFDIEADIYRGWAELLRTKIKPEVMICGHFHELAVKEPGDKSDHLGHPCTVVVGSLPIKPSDTRSGHFTGSGFAFNENGYEVEFTDSDGKTVEVK